MKCNIEELYKIFLKHPHVSTDTRSIKEGSVFFALKGSNFNGNKFASEAVEKCGAAFAVIDEAEYEAGDRFLLVADVLKALQDLSLVHRESLKIPVIGITGTNGKTTTKELVTAVLKQKYNIAATIGNLNNHIGVPLTLLAIKPETEIAIVEMGANHLGEIGELCKLSKPTLGLITNIGIAHTEGFGSYENIIATKKALYDYIIANHGLLFVNEGDDLLMKLSEGSERKLYGKQDIIQTYNDSPLLRFGLKVKDSDGNGYRQMPVQTNLIGSYNLENILAAICIGEHFNVDGALIKKALEEYMPGGYRSQFIDTGRNQVIMDAYNANPTSMDKAIINFGSLNAKNKVAIIGDMFELGKLSQQEHVKIIELLKKQNIDEAYLVGPEFIKANDRFMTFESSEAAKDYFIKNPLNSKTILIKGSRGIKLEKILEAL